jgi:hypothetical protein
MAGAGADVGGARVRGAVEVEARAERLLGIASAPLWTVQYYADWLARHERPHRRQLERIVNTMHM